MFIKLHCGVGKTNKKQVVFKHNRDCKVDNGSRSKNRGRMQASRNQYAVNDQDSQAVVIRGFFLKQYSPFRQLSNSGAPFFRFAPPNISALGHIVFTST